ncbi:hypothetical protein KR222_006579, partial [Zaprionus bogoriensis]
KETSRINVQTTETPTTILNNVDDFNVFSQKCKIPRIDPFSEETMKIFQPSESIKCTKVPDLVIVQFDLPKKQYVLHVNETMMTEFFHVFQYQCFYYDLRRGRNDSLIWFVLQEGTTKISFPLYYKIYRIISYRQYGPYPFEQDFLVPRHIQGIIVKCYEPSNMRNVLQTNAFTFVQYQTHRNDRVDEERTRIYPNVILLGIDSMSQMNFKRTMRETAKFVSQPGWYEMLGYNKIGDNTLPNIMPLLSGRTPEQWRKYCDTKKAGCLDSLTYLWNHYHNSGYLTAYGEDLSEIDTFHYHLKGFMHPPVDFYLHPFMQAAEGMLSVLKQYGYAYCLGRRESYRYVLDYMLQLVERFVYEMPKPLFAFFWLNSFSHDDYTGPVSVDADFVRYFKRFEELGLFERSIVILFSDHGQRYGPLMKLSTSFLEERLPMLHIHLPAWYREQYPEIAKALDVNRRRLTSTWDLHYALRHVLQLVQPRFSFPEPPFCEKCQSIFTVVSENRSCQEATIPEHWCSCAPYKQLEITDTLHNLAKITVYRINLSLRKQKIHNLCHELKLRKLLKAEQKIFFDDNGKKMTSSNGVEMFRFKFITDPTGGIFQATIESSQSPQLIHVHEDEITRLNSYHNESFCVVDVRQKMFCVCRQEKIGTIR